MSDTLIPFGHLPAKERRQIQRLVQAAQSALSVLNVLASSDGRSPFWSPSGSGGRAIHNLGVALRSCDLGDRGEKDSAFWEYMRNTLPLLGLDDSSGFWDWKICVSECGGKIWFSSSNGSTKCSSCGGPTRKITWSDLGEEEDPDDELPDLP